MLRPGLESRGQAGGPSCTLPGPVIDSLGRLPFWHTWYLTPWETEHEPEPTLALEQPSVNQQGLPTRTDQATPEYALLPRCSLRSRGGHSQYPLGLGWGQLPRAGTAEPVFKGKGVGSEGAPNSEKLEQRPRGRSMLLGAGVAPERGVPVTE